MTDEKSRKRFWMIVLLTLLVLTITTIIEDAFDLGLFIMPSMPGFIIYVLVTGDINGWQPGPIGKVGRIAVQRWGLGYFGYR